MMQSFGNGYLRIPTESSLEWMWNRAVKPKETVNHVQVLREVVDKNVTVVISFQYLWPFGMGFWLIVCAQVVILTHFW